MSRTRRLVEQRELAAYRHQHRSCLLCDYIALELRLGERIVCANDAFAAIVPFWAVWPFETLVVSTRHVDALPSLRDDERDALADILKQLTTRYDNLFEAPFPYSMGFHQQPMQGAADGVAHLHAHFYPPLLRSASVRKFMVGFELLGSPQRDFTPEDAAARLRAVSPVHYTERRHRGATMKRREFLGLAALPLAQALNQQPVRSLRGRVIGIEGADAVGVELTTPWLGSYCRPRVRNRTSRAIRIKEVVLFDVALAMPPETALYGEGFQMLSQTGGTLGTPADLSQYTDAKHYRIPEADNARAFYGVVTLTPPGRDTTLCAFTSCARFSGRFRLSGGAAPRLAAVIDTRDLPSARAKPGSSKS
jgi:diadenosine tetraphosphate (Ap4A) HIT family hydrolase